MGSRELLLNWPSSLNSIMNEELNIKKQEN